MSEKPEYDFNFSKNEDIEAVNSAQQDKNEESVNQKINKRDVSREARIRAEKAIIESLDLDSDDSLDNFQEKLMAAIESLTQYQELEQKLADVPPEQLSYELFKTFQRSADSSDSYDREKALHKDGVLVKQIKQGSPLMCTGRVMIASTFLQKRGIEHNVISTVEGDEDDASGHSAILLNVGEDKLAYFDAQNNLYFTFPKSALRGYAGAEKTSECVLEECTPDENDVIDGLNSINTRFVTSPPSEGISRQYFTNIKSALGGGGEFAHSGIVPDSEAIEAVDQIEREIFGENSILEKREQRMEELIKRYQGLIAKNKKTASLTLEKFPKKEDFIDSFSSILRDNNEMAEIYPYLKNASVDIRRKAAEKIWDHLQKIESAHIFEIPKVVSEKEIVNKILKQLKTVKESGVSFDEIDLQERKKALAERPIIDSNAFREATVVLEEEIFSWVETDKIVGRPFSNQNPGGWSFEYSERKGRIVEIAKELSAAGQDDQKIENVFHPGKLNERIKLSVLEGPSGPMYSVEDGTHRVAGAMTASLREIPCNIKRIRYPLERVTTSEDDFSDWQKKIELGLVQGKIETLQNSKGKKVYKLVVQKEVLPWIRTVSQNELIKISRIYEKLYPDSLDKLDVPRDALIDPIANNYFMAGRWSEWEEKFSHKPRDEKRMVIY